MLSYLLNASGTSRLLELDILALMSRVVGLSQAGLGFFRETCCGIGAVHLSREVRLDNTTINLQYSRVAERSEVCLSLKARRVCSISDSKDIQQ